MLSSIRQIHLTVCLKDLLSTEIFFSFACQFIDMFICIISFGRLGLMVAGGVALASFMTYASERLAMSAFNKGLKDRNASRSRSFCFFW
jgi:hypothetical protein